jgi:hypothetical protein
MDDFMWEVDGCPFCAPSLIYSADHRHCRSVKRLKRHRYAAETAEAARRKAVPRLKDQTEPNQGNA